MRSTTSAVNARKFPRIILPPTQLSSLGFVGLKTVAVVKTDCGREFWVWSGMGGWGGGRVVGGRTVGASPLLK